VVGEDLEERAERKGIALQVDDDRPEVHDDGDAESGEDEHLELLAEDIEVENAGGKQERTPVMQDTEERAPRRNP
jgi:hypothetical protein